MSGMVAFETAPRPHEDAQVKYARQTRNAVVITAWIVTLSAAFAVIFGLIVGIDMIHLADAVNSSTSQSCSNNPGSFLPSC